MLSYCKSWKKSNIFLLKHTYIHLCNHINIRDIVLNFKVFVNVKDLHFKSNNVHSTFLKATLQSDRSPVISRQSSYWLKVKIEGKSVFAIVQSVNTLQRTEVNIPANLCTLPPHHYCSTVLPFCCLCHQIPNSLHWGHPLMAYYKIQTSYYISYKHASVTDTITYIVSHPSTINDLTSCFG